MAKKILGILLNSLIVIAVIIIVLVIYSVIQTKMLKKDYVNFFGYTVFQVATGSMSSTMEIKDIIIVKILMSEELKVDDIVVYKQEKATITHRIIEIDKDKITTKGDANNAKDKPIARSDIIGKVVKIIPNIGIWEKVFTTPKVYISIIITITLWGVTILYKPEKPEKSNKPNKRYKPEKKINTGGEKTNEEKADDKKE